MKSKNKSNEDELVQSISKLAESGQLLALQAVVLYSPIVENIIDTKCTDNQKIEHTMDYMLDFCFHDQMLLLFKKLCRYYFYINPQSTTNYINSYREMWDNPEDETNKEND